MLISPIMDMLIIAYITSTIGFVLNKKLVDQRRLFELEQKERKLREKVLQDERYIDEYNKLLKEKLHLTKNGLKGLIITMPIIIVLLFWILPPIYDKYGVLINLFGLKLNWFGVYILFSLIINLSMEQVFRKLWWYYAKTGT